MSLQNWICDTTGTNVFYPNINLLRKYIQIINDYNSINFLGNDYKIEHLDFCFSNDIETHKRDYNKDMKYLEFYYFEYGIVVFKLNLLNFEFESYFPDEDVALIKNFLNTDFDIDFESFKKKRIRQIKIKKIIN